jgi:hypothetical protein
MKQYILSPIRLHDVALNHLRRRQLHLFYLYHATHNLFPKEGCGRENVSKSYLVHRDKQHDREYLAKYLANDICYTRGIYISPGGMS